jgi:hypothetical protein
VAAGEEREGGPPTPATARTVRAFHLLDESTGRPRAPVTNQRILRANRDLPVLDGDFLACGAARLRRTRG